MKKSTLLLATVILLLFSGTASARTGPDEKTTGKDQPVTFYCTSDLKALASGWADQYCRLHPQAVIKVEAVPAGELGSRIGDNAGVGFVSGTSLPAGAPVWRIVVGRDVIVPVINSRHPQAAEIAGHGLAPATIAGLLSGSPQMITDQPLTVNGYLFEDETLYADLSEFMGFNPQHSKAAVVSGGPAVVSAVQKDNHGMGFCRLTDAINSGTGKLKDGIMFLPIDRNANGKLDYYEKIYGNLDDFTRGVWIGKYPKALISNLYAVAPALPENPTQTAFLKWTITDGQKNLEANGFTGLVSSEKQTMLEAFVAPQISMPADGNSYAWIKLVLIVALLLLGGWGIISLVMWRTEKPEKKPANNDGKRHHLPGEQSLNYPEGLYFDKTHTWAFLEKEGRVRVGIDDFLQHVTGKFTRIKMKAVGDQVKKNEAVLSLMQDGKQITVYSPVSGTISGVNETLQHDPSLINASPYDQGWIYLIEPSNWWRELQFLRMAENYRDWLRFEYVRLKDFLATMALGREIRDEKIIFQDGGTLLDNVLCDFGPEVWEEFQKNFIDNSALK